MASLWRDEGGALGYGGAAAYSAAAHVAGVALLLRVASCGSLLAAALCALGGVALAAHGRVVAAYLVHEAAHGSVFKSIAHNTSYGTACLWICGTPYADFFHVRKLHLAHHFDRADTCAFDYREFLNARPLLRRAVLAAEWAFIPAVECIMHANIAFSWADSALPRRRRVIAATGSAVVAAFWAGLGYAGGAAAVALYALSTNMFLQVLAIHDAFQHTYEVLVQGPGQPYTPGPGPRDAKYEEENTFSDLISLRYPLLNALVLNFGYHNSHHRQPMTPWYKLPALHAKLYGPLKASERVLPMRLLSGSWVRHRVKRVLDSKEAFEAMLKKSGPERAAAFVGDLGVSFLTM